MSQNVYDVLQERGFIAQTTHEELRELDVYKRQTMIRVL